MIYSWNGAENYSPSAFPIIGKRKFSPYIFAKKKFTAGTVLFPLLFMAIHMAVLTFGVIIASVATGISSAAQGAFTNGDELNFSDEQIFKMMSTSQIYGMLGAMPVLIVVYALITVLMKRRWTHIEYTAPSKPGFWFASAGMAMGALGMTSILLFVITLLARDIPYLNDLMDYYETLSGTLTNGAGAFIQIFTICILVPIAEEMLFRGLILSELRNAMSDGAAIIVNGVLFAAYHMNLVQSAYVLPVGLMLAALAVWSRSIWPSVLIHVIYNFFGSGFGILVNGDEGILSILTVVELAFIPVSILCIVLSYLSYRKTRSKMKSLADQWFIANPAPLPAPNFNQNFYGNASYGNFSGNYPAGDPAQPYQPWGGTAWGPSPYTPQQSWTGPAASAPSYEPQQPMKESRSGNYLEGSTSGPYDIDRNSGSSKS